jgi:hypothetical protein
MPFMYIPVLGLGSMIGRSMVRRCIACLVIATALGTRATVHARLDASTAGNYRVLRPLHVWRSPPVHSRLPSLRKGLRNGALHNALDLLAGQSSPRSFLPFGHIPFSDGEHGRTTIRAICLLRRCLLWCLPRREARLQPFAATNPPWAAESKLVARQLPSDLCRIEDRQRRRAL